MRFPNTFWGGLAKGYFWVTAIGLPVAILVVVAIRMMRGEM